jgi:hypothetical protein
MAKNSSSPKMPIGPLAFHLKDRLATRGVSTAEARRYGDEARGMVEPVRVSMAPEAPLDRPSNGPSDLALREALVRQALRHDEAARRREQQTRQRQQQQRGRQNRRNAEPTARLLERELSRVGQAGEPAIDEGVSRAYAVAQHQRLSALPVDLPPSQRFRLLEGSDPDVAAEAREAQPVTFSETVEPARQHPVSEPPPTTRRLGLKA